MGQYATIADAQTYFDGRLNSEAWEDATTPDQDKSLITATKAIDRLNFAGDKFDSEQELQFPRGTDTSVPQDIVEACCEMAYSLLDGREPEIDYENLSMVSQGYGNVRSTYDRDINPLNELAGVTSIVAWRLLLPYLRVARSVTMIRV